MSNIATILDSPVEFIQNFSALRIAAQQTLRSKVGQVWSDYNDSDPGMTILDQLLYALTELGYCTDFTIEDVLTNAKGEIDLDGQFFTADEILTTSALSANDYRKLLLDRLDSVNQVFVSNINHTLVFHLIVSTRADPDDVLRQCFQWLGENRNVGEHIAYPQLLTPLNVDLSQSIIVVQTTGDIEAVRQLIEHSLMQSSMGRFDRYAYRAVLDQAPADAFSGPPMNEGWILEEDLDSYSSLPQFISAHALNKQISATPGVESAKIRLPEQLSYLTIPDGRYPSFSGFDEISITAVQADPVSNRALKSLTTAQHDVSNSIAIRPQPPKGVWRDIENYYSIQHTFPSQYSIGCGESSGNWPTFRLAQINQLKGYLLAFDQVLANQFSQLANVGTLFSFDDHFEFAQSGDEVLDEIPYREFPATYFTQPLYEVPGVKALLAGSESFDFVRDDDGQAGHAAWQQYKADPFNTYMLGLSKGAESSTTLLERRNHMLDHLLARHGVAATDIDKLILQPQWRGDLMITRIVLKTVLMQNYQKLSFNRAQGYNVTDGQRLGTPGRYRLLPDALVALADLSLTKDESAAVLSMVNQGYSTKDSLKVELTNILQAHTAAVGYVENMPINDGNGTILSIQRERSERNGVLNLRRLTHSLRVTDTQLQRTSTFEIEADLRLGLRHHLRLVRHTLQSILLDKKCLLWMIQTSIAEPFTQAGTGLTIYRGQDSDKIYVDGVCLAEIEHVVDSWPKTYQLHLDQLQWLYYDSRSLILVEEALLIAAQTHTHEQYELGQFTPLWLNPLTIRTVFPQWISLYHSPGFKKDWNTSTQLLLPAHLRVGCVELLPFSQFSEMILHYCDFYNNFEGMPNRTAAGAAIAIAESLDVLS